MIPKPLSFIPKGTPTVKPRRLHERKRVTITVGFLCSDGIVLGADSQESIEGSILKRSVPKLIVAPPVPTLWDRLQRTVEPDRRAIFTGAGHGPLIDKLVAEAWTEISIAPPSVADIAQATEDAIIAVYKKYRSVYQSGYMPHAELLYGLWCKDTAKLFHASGPVVNQIGGAFGGALVGYKAAGLGSEITDYIAKRMYDKNFKVRSATILAIYMLKQAVDHAEGCGGDIQVAALYNNGAIENVEASKSLTTSLLENLDSRFSQLMVAAADTEFKESLLDLLWQYTRKYIAAYRSGRGDIAAAERQNEQDVAEVLRQADKLEQSLKQSGAQTSGDQQ